MFELFQALVGAALPDHDDDYDAWLLNRLTSHVRTLSHDCAQGYVWRRQSDGGLPTDRLNARANAASDW